MISSKDSRRLLGQHFTPEPLADFVCSLGVRSPADRVLDPACGDGAFLRAALRRLWALGAPAAAGQVSGFEIDEACAAAAREAAPGAAVTAGDFFRRPPEPLFDAIIGNFPFVRQELLSEGKGFLKDVVRGEWLFDYPEVDRLTGRADLYLYFVFHAARFLKDGGRMAVITGNSWLHVPYGKVLREFLLSKLGLVSVFESRAEVWFPHTSVNAAISLIERKGPAREVTFVQLGKPLGPGQEGLPEGASARRVPAGPLRSRDNWSCYLRAPQVYFDALERAGARLVPLARLASIRRGVTTGLNRFFLLEKAEAERLGLEPEFLVPAVASLKGIESLSIRPEHARHCLLVVDRARDGLRGTRMLDCIESFERDAGAALRSPTLRGREPWYRLSLPEPADFLVPRFRRERHFSPLNPHGIAVADTVFAVRARERRHATLCCAAANSTLFHFCAEVTGRDNMGGGFITTYGPEIRALPVPAPACLEPFAAETGQALAELCRRPVLTMARELERGDRRRLDEIIWRAIGVPLTMLDDLCGEFAGLLARRKAHGQMAGARASSGGPGSAGDVPNDV